MAKVQLRYGVDRFVVVAHSMGGLVSRGFILRREARVTRAAFRCSSRSRRRGMDTLRLNLA